MKVTIVGGGFAGAVAGLWLQQDGVEDVRILEAKSVPGTTPCGEGLSARTLALLDPVFDAKPFIDRTFQGARWRFPGTQVTVRQECHTMAREVWIPAMLDQFQSQGGTVEYGARLDGQAIKDLDAAVIVGCDGPGSTVRSLVPGARFQTALGLQVRLQSDADTPWLEFLTDKRFSPEYAWWFPRTDFHNVGLLGYGDGQDKQRLLDLVKLLGIEGRVLRHEAYPIGFGGRTVASPDGRFLVLGDAAGMTNPLTKGGMAAILHAAPLLAQAVGAGRPGQYQASLNRHPVLAPAYGKALALLRRWSNQQFARNAQAIGPSLEVNSMRMSTAIRIGARLLLRDPRAVRHAPLLLKAGRLSLSHSW